MIMSDKSNTHRFPRMHQKDKKRNRKQKDGWLRLQRNIKRHIKKGIQS